MRLLVAVPLAAVVLGVAPPALAADPAGYLDGAGCDAIVGWAHDTDTPDTPIDVHFYYGGPAGSGAPASAINANVYREDLCVAIGSCAHGFSAATTLSLLDGQPRDIYAYGINSGAGGNPALGNAPRVLTCAPPAQTGVRRLVDGLATLDAWKFQNFWDLLPAGSGAETLTESAPLPAVPELVQADDGTLDVWLLDQDGHVRRLVTPAAMAAWRFDAATIQVFPAAEILGLIEGTQVRARPVTFIAGSLYVVDDEQPASATGPTLTTTSSGAGGSSVVGGGSPEGGAAASAGGAGEGGRDGADVADANPFGSCACRVEGAGGVGAAWPALGLVVAALMRRRRATEGGPSRRLR